MTKNEYSVASFYYRYFSENKTNINCQSIISDDDDDDDGKACDDNGGGGDRNKIVHERMGGSQSAGYSPNVFWTEDVWTSSDERNAEQILMSHLEKCTISNSLTSAPQQHHNNDDAFAWDEFYTNHGTRFFKDRHYLDKAFPDEFSSQKQSKDIDSSNSRTLVEIGCGVGNLLMPLFETENGSWEVIHGLDISKEAIRLLREDDRFLSFNERGKTTTPPRAAFGHVCDISQEFSLPKCCVGVSNVTTLLFCLSAIDPKKMATAAKNVASTLKPGGKLVFRDYGRYDEAQIKLGTSRSKQISEHFYRKHDGTKCFYFTTEDVQRLFGTESGLHVIELKYLRRIYHNKATGQKRRRVWVQGRFWKPDEGNTSAN
jgi:SAM-dependent methyltransferase